MQTIAGHPLSQAVVRAIASKAVSAAMVLCLSLIVFSDRTRAQNAPRPPNPAFEKIEDRPGLPRVLLIGDSISIGYTLDTRKLLEGKANLHRIPVNGGPTTRGLESIDSWLGDGPWAVIHFNWGLHDLKFMEDGKHQAPLAEYETNLRRLVARLKKTGARLIWASTTPVPNAKLSPPRKNSDVIAYNAAARGIMVEHDIAINDLYQVALPRLAEMQRPANVHFTNEGYQRLAEQASAAVLEALRQRR